MPRLTILIQREEAQKAEAASAGPKEAPAPAPAAKAPSSRTSEAPDWRDLRFSHVPAEKAGPKLLFYTCEHYDGEDTGACLCPEMARKGPLVKMIGKHPACVLIGASREKVCGYYKRVPERKNGDLFEQVQAYEAEHPEGDE